MIINRYVWFSLCWFIGTLFALFQPSTSFPEIEFSLPLIDKIMHFLLFLVQWGLACGIFFTKKLKIPYITLFCLALGWSILSELIQLYLTNRNGEIGDVIADLLGALVALLLSYQYQQKKRSLERL